MPRQINLLAGLNVPDAGGLVIGRRHNAPTIGTKSSASHDPVMFENGGLLTRFRVPQARRFVRRGRNHLPAIGAEGRNPHRFCVPPKNGQLIAILGIPHAGRLVLGSGHNTPAIRREARAPQQAFVALQDNPFFKVLVSGEQSCLRLVHQGSFHAAARVRQCLKGEQHRCAGIARLVSLVRAVDQEARL